MNNIVKAMACASTMFSIFLLAACGGSQDNGQNIASVSSTQTSVQTTLSLPQQINQYLDSHQSDSTAGISILVLKDGKEIYSASKGMANINSGISVSRSTGFRLASVSKSFTAIAIMQLIENGQLKLSDSVLDYIPELSPTWKPITIEMLLTHQSGIYDIFNDFWKPSIINNLTMDGLITYLINNPALEFNPGSRGDYSNTGYMLLAKIIERKTRLTFSEYMAKNVFEPANMRGSYINDSQQDIKLGDAINYGNRNTYYGISTYVYGSMAQVSSTDDFANFFDALRKGKLVSDQTLFAMTSRHSSLNYGGYYGYGFVVGNTFYGHDGEWDGFETSFAVDTARHLESVILTNSGTVGRNHINAINALIRNASL